MLPYVLLVAAALASARAPDVTVGQPALLFLLPAINEDIAMDLVNRPTVALSDFAGIKAPSGAKGVVLHFFDKEHGGDTLDLLNRIQRRYANKGVQVVAISTDTGEMGALSTWIEGLRLDYPVLRDNHGVVVGRYGVETLPMTFVIDAEGYVFAIGQPLGDDFEDQLTAELDPLVKK